MKFQMAQVYQTFREEIYETQMVLLWFFPPQSKLLESQGKIKLQLQEKEDCTVKN